MRILIGQTVTRFWYGDKFIFERVSAGEWKCIYQDSQIIPAIMIEELGQ